MINPDLNVLELKETFSEREILMIDDFCVSDFAMKVSDYLNHLPEEKWYVTCCPIAEKVRQYKSFLNTEKNQPFINHLSKVALEQYKKGNYAYRFKRTYYANDMPPEGPELDLKCLFESRDLIQVVRQITGKDISGINSFFSSCYENGDFLARHSDEGNGIVGFVYYVTQNWEEAWGGNIEFVERKTLQTHASHFPNYNNLLLFSIKDLPHIQHEVKMISEYAKEKRLAFSGWFK